MGIKRQISGNYLCPDNYLTLIRLPFFFKDNSIYGKSRISSETGFKKKSETTFPGYSISDEIDIDK